MKLNKVVWRYPFADIFLFNYNKSDNTLTYANEVLRSWWPDEYYIAPNFSTYLTTFGNLKMRTLKGSEDFLIRNYGTNWRQIGQTVPFAHYTLTKPKPVKFLVNSDLLVPAEPFH